MEDKTRIAVEELKEFLRRKIEAAKAILPGEGWEEYYRGRLSAFEEIEVLLNNF